MTQKQVIISKLKEQGYVDNFWCVNNYILRLGAIICDLKKEGWEFRGKFGDNAHRKNFYYYVLKQPGEQSVHESVNQFFKDFPIKKEKVNQLF